MKAVGSKLENAARSLVGLPPLVAGLELSGITADAAMVSLRSPATVPEKRHNLTHRVKRVAAVEAAGKLMGRAVLAASCGIPERTMRSYAAVDRQLPDMALRMTARALRRHAEAAIAQAEAIDALLVDGG